MGLFLSGVCGSHMAYVFVYRRQRHTTMKLLTKHKGGIMDNSKLNINVPKGKRAGKWLRHSAIERDLKELVAGLNNYVWLEEDKALWYKAVDAAHSCVMDRDRFGREEWAAIWGSVGCKMAIMVNDSGHIVARGLVHEETNTYTDCYGGSWYMLEARLRHAGMFKNKPTHAFLKTVRDKCKEYKETHMLNVIRYMYDNVPSSKVSLTEKPGYRYIPKQSKAIYAIWNDFIYEGENIHIDIPEHWLT